MADALVMIASDTLTVGVNPTGAELWSIADRAGGNYMTNADPAFWTGRAPLLFPVVGSVVDDRIVVGGRDYPMARHGFARRSAFMIITHGADHAHFRLTDSAATCASYPYAFALDMMFHIDGWHLAMIAQVTNTGDVDLPFSLGFHPAFSWPLPGNIKSPLPGNADKAAHCLTFAEAEPAPIRRVSPTTGLLLPDAAPSPVTGRTLVLDPALFVDDAIIWTELHSRALRYGAPGGASLDLAFPDTPMLGLWQVPGAAYICIEPWQGHADPQGFTGEFATKPGLVALAPGEVRQFRLSVTVNPA